MYIFIFTYAIYCAKFQQHSGNDLLRPSSSQGETVSCRMGSSHKAVIRTPFEANKYHRRTWALHGYIYIYPIKKKQKMKLLLVNGDGYIHLQ